MLVIIDGCQVVCFVTVFRSPIKTVGILGAEAELGGYVKRPDATLDEAILFRNKIIQICLVRIRGVGDGGAVLQLADRRMKSCLINLVVPAHMGDSLTRFIRQVIIIVGSVGQDLKRLGGRWSVGQFHVVIVSRVVEPFLFREQVVKEVEPASSRAYQIRELILDNRALEGR